MVLDLLGPNLEELFTFCGRRFSTKTILLIGIQLLTRLEKIHTRGLVFRYSVSTFNDFKITNSRDLKPENVLIGRKSMKKENILHIIDYGLAKPYIDSETKQHIAFAGNRPITGKYFLKSEIIFSSLLFSPGTVRYMSVNAHLGVEQSRRDDLEALGYLLTYFFRGGKLPWMGFHIENTRERFRKIGQCKQLINIHKFCKDMPREFAIYFRYIKTLRFSETPDYNYLRFEHKILFLSLLVIAEHC